MELTSWNRFAIRFIDPPRFEWNSILAAAEYQVQFATSGSCPQTVITSQPSFDFQPYWGSFPYGPIDFVITARDADGRAIDQITPQKIAKAPDFDQQTEIPANWAASAVKYAEWLFGLPSGENGEPVFLYSSGMSYFDHRLSPVVYPALHHSSHIFFALEVARQFPHTRLGVKSGRVARDIGDWFLAHTLDESYRCSRFPLSTFMVGEPTFQVAEENSITLFRAARAGVAMVSLFNCFGDDRYLDYAKHLAGILTEFQSPDGSWPYRVNPQTGEVVEAYTSAAICIVKFFETLQQVVSSEDYQQNIDAAVRWTLENPVQNNRWQGMYEDIRPKPPYGNLENQDTLEMVRFLCRNAQRYPNAIATAERLNRYVEDQFVIFGPYASHLPGQPVHPTVMEQYCCYWPMPGHTGNWLRALMALHQATGKEIYYVKAVRAANAITRLQLDDGSYHTRGIDYRYKTMFHPSGFAWFGNGARAAYALLRFQEYVAKLAKIPA